MKCDRTKPDKFWIRFGRAAALSGKTVEWAAGPIAPAHTKVKEWIAIGHAAGLAKAARNAKRRA